MSKRMDLVGKTITGVVAARDNENGSLKIWMLQFSDGSHVEFVSPGARRRLRESARRPCRVPEPEQVEAQLALNVA